MYIDEQGMQICSVIMLHASSKKLSFYNMYLLCPT